MPERTGKTKRIQLTLFIGTDFSTEIEQVRQKFNPKQVELIKSHVTLCREDELREMKIIKENLQHLDCNDLIINFEKPIRFSEGTGVLLPASAENASFQYLRKKILKGIEENPRLHQPHITLMHPRNSTCTDTIFPQIEKINFPQTISFHKISWIEQKANNKWEILKEFFLHKI